jgi:hypothetical protein
MKRVSFEALFKPGTPSLVIFEYEDSDGSPARIWGCKTKFLFKSFK